MFLTEAMGEVQLLSHMCTCALRGDCASSAAAVGHWQGAWR